MPANFNSSLPTVQVGPGNFRAEAYVDSSGDLEGLDKALEGAAQVSNQLVLNSFEKESQKDLKAEEELYTKARNLKRGIYEAGLAGDQKAEIEFQAQLENLKIAERQGAITGTNSQIRQESALKNFINRYPHLEDSFRKSYSSTRARADASSKEQFEDPIEAGVDAAIKSATAEGKTVGTYLNEQRLKAQLDFDMKNLEYKAKLGQSLEVDLDLTIQTALVPLAVSSAQGFIKAGVAEFNQKGLDYDGNKAKSDFIARGKLEAATAVANMYRLVKAANNPNAQVSRQFLESRRLQIEQVFTDIAATGVFDSFDSLKSMQRSMEIGSIKSIQELGRFSPVLGFLAQQNPEGAAEIVLRDFSKSMELYKSGRRDALAQLGDSSTNTIDAARLKFQLALIDQWSGQDMANDFASVVRDGAPLNPTGTPGFDAAKSSILTTTVLRSNSTTPEEKSNAVKSALETEKLNSKEGEFAPSAVWYKDPVRRKVLQTNEKVKADFTSTLDSAAATMVSTTLQALGESFIFAPQPEFEDPKQPWKFYSQGGPFSAPKAKDTQKGALTPELGNTLPGKLGPPMGSNVESATKSLNDMYWSYRYMYGRAEAEKWAFNIIDEAKSVRKEKEAADKKDKEQAAKSKDENFDPK